MKIPQKKKAHYCKFNTNRFAYTIVEPYCNWLPSDKYFPPHLILYSTTKLTELICAKCKCFELDEDLIKQAKGNKI